MKTIDIALNDQTTLAVSATHKKIQYYMEYQSARWPRAHLNSEVKRSISSYMCLHK